MTVDGETVDGERLTVDENMRQMLTALILLMLAIGTSASAQDWMKAVTTPRTIVLWPDGAPGAIGKEDADVPH